MHVLKFMEDANDLPDILVVLLANNGDNDHHPLRAKMIHEHGRLEMYEKGITGKVSTNRQDLPPCYFLAHNFWVLNVSFLMSGKEGRQPWSFMGNRIVPYFIETSVDIHDKADLLLAKEWVSTNL